MDYSDDEVEALPDSVWNYHFLDHDDEPVSFSVLPLLWINPNENATGQKGGVFLHGSADKGLKIIYREVCAWKFDLTNVSPEISVLSKEKSWFKLQKPRKSYEGTIRSVLITVNCLHYLKRNPESSAKSLWDYMAKAFSTYEFRPAAKDLAEHTSLISEAIKRDDGLAKCKFIATFLEEKPWLRKLSSEDVQSPPKPSFIVEDDEMEIMEDDPDEEDEDVFDSVCAICDNGGDLLCCEGRCMRSFHATTQSGEDSICASLGLTDAEVEAIQQFLCKNCIHKQHQCFVCGKLGSSDKSTGAEVFSCVSATCGRFYHSHCVAKLLSPKDVDAAKELQKTIAAGKSFTCPIHKCFVCGKGEQKKTPELQFAVCRRCPRSYHRKCLPKSITFEDSEGEDATRAWEGLLPNHVLIYCLKHELDEELGTPVRNHIKFPHVEDKKTAMTVKRKKPTPELSSGTEKRGAEKKTPASNELNRVSTKAPDQKEKISSLADRSVKRKKVNVSSQQEIRKKVKVADVSGQSQKNSKKVGSLVGGKSSLTKEKEETVSLGQRLYNVYVDGSETEEVQPLKEDDALASETPSKKLDYYPPKLDADSERRIRDIIKEATSSVSMQDILEKRKLPSAQNLKNTVDRSITMGKLEGAVEAARTALQKIEEGGSIEDAQAVCDPDVLSQLFKWKDKLKVYLSPFIFGTRYTSFGRHFTKVDKLQEIVDKLHWYVENGDTIVDFCCGANDFSCLMAKRLEESGKNCSYKNYDLFPAKNTFNFERRDWMSVTPKELPPGNKLIMGLNPPFGLNATLANKFIDKALEFKPKLLILIVPPETQRLDKKRSAYDLVWEDNNFLSGKSFYLPGSVDENDKQMDQWNLNTPVLYLWSRPGWTQKHKAIARTQGHLEGTGSGTPFLDSSGTDPSDPGGVPSVADDGVPRQRDQAEETKEGPVVSEGRKGSFSRSNSGKETLKSQAEESKEGPVVSEGRKGSFSRSNSGKETIKSQEEETKEGPVVSEGRKGSFSRSNSGKETLKSQAEESKEGPVVSEGRKGSFSRSNSGKETIKSQEEETKEGPVVSEGRKGSFSRSNSGKETLKSQAEESKEGPVVSEGRKWSFSRSNSGKETLKSRDNQTHNGSRKKRHDKMSEESSCPPRETNIRSPVDVHSSKSDMSLDSDIGGRRNHQPHFESLLPELEVDYAAGLDSIVEDIGRTYGLTSDELRSREMFSTSLSPHPEYSARSLEDPNRGHLRERADGIGSSAITQADERYWRDLDNRTQVRLYGRQHSDPPQRTSLPAYFDPPPPYLDPPLAYIDPPPAYLDPPPPYLDPPPYLQARPAPSTYGLVAPPPAESSYHMNTSTMQRYAPRLDELNPPRMVNDPLGIRRPGIYDPRAGGYQGNRQGFAPGPYSPFSQTNSSGWLNE